MEGGTNMRCLLKKRAVSILLILALTISCLPASVLMADKEEDHDHVWARATDLSGWYCEDPGCNAFTTEHPPVLNEVLDSVCFEPYYRIPDITFTLTNVHKGVSLLEMMILIYLTEDSVITPSKSYRMGTEMVEAGTPIHASDFVNDDGTNKILCVNVGFDGSLVMGWDEVPYQPGDCLWFYSLRFYISNSGGIAPITYWCKESDSEMTGYAISNILLHLKTEGLKAVPGGANQVKLSWTPSSDAQGYLVYGLKNGTYGYAGMTTQGATFTDTKAIAGEYNYYWVFPYIKDTSGKMRVGKCPNYVYAKGGLPAAANLKASSVKGGVKLTWDKVMGAEGYLVYGIVDGKAYAYVGMTTKGTTFTDKTASKTQYNYYWVFPYFTDTNGKMVPGQTGKYTYGRAI